MVKKLHIETICQDWNRFIKCSVRDYQYIVSFASNPFILCKNIELISFNFKSIIFFKGCDLKRSAKMKNGQF